MSNAAVNAAVVGRRVASDASSSEPAPRRRYGWMSAEDYRFLRQLDAAGSAGWADELERMMHAEARRAARIREHETPECELGDGISIDFIVCDRAARQSFGTGGGRRRRAPAGPHA